MSDQGEDEGRAVALPAIVPVFPLPGVLLLPRARLPLHIFEPRYRAMTMDALDADGMIAMAQPRDPESADASPALYDVACLGRIVESEQLEDGRWLLTLEGVIRLRIREELPLKNGYRRVSPDYSDFPHDLDPMSDGPALDREGLLAALGVYLDARGLSADCKAIGKLPDEPLVNALAMACPFLPAEKQALLQAVDVRARAGLLSTLLQLSATHEAANDDEPPRPN